MLWNNSELQGRFVQVRSADSPGSPQQAWFCHAHAGLGLKYAGMPAWLAWQAILTTTGVLRKHRPRDRVTRQASRPVAAPGLALVSLARGRRPRTHPVLSSGSNKAWLRISGTRLPVQRAVHAWLRSQRARASSAVAALLGSRTWQAS
jgi:hypothetical protein